MFTRARHWFLLSQINPLHTQSSLQSHLRLCLPNGLVSPVFPTKILYAFLISPVRTTCPTDILLHLNLIILMMSGEREQITKLLIMYFSQSLVTSSPLGPNILLREQENKQSIIWIYCEFVRQGWRWTCKQLYILYGKYNADHHLGTSSFVCNENRAAVTKA
jgi:hypothetical protein